jgi:multidrug efflux pump subunit AcrB
MEALAIVLAVSLLSLGWRTGIVVGLSVPIVLGVVALVMLAMGWNLERVSLGSLIIALGLLVDDGIIAVEMMVGEDGRRLGSPESGRLFVRRDRDAAADRCAHHRRRLHAHRLSPNRPPANTRAASSGSSVRPVLFSWVVSGIITPYLAVNMLPKDFGKHQHGADPYDTPLSTRKLRRLIDLAVAAALVGIGVTVAALAVAIAG